MSQQKKITVVHTTAAHLISDTSFFANFDEGIAIEIVKSHLKTLDLYSREIEVLADNKDELGKLIKARDTIRLEIYFTVIHSIETLIYLALSIFEDEGVLISMINAINANEAAKDILDGKYDKLSNGKVANKGEFYSYSLLGGCKFDHPAVKDLLDNTSKLFDFCCQIYINSVDAYNSYKHGMRIQKGPTAFYIADATVENPEYIPIFDSQDSIQYFRKSKIKDPKYKYYDLETCVFDFSTVLKLNDLVRILFLNIKNTRLAKVSGDGKALLTPLTESEVQEILDNGHKFGIFSQDVGPIE